MAVISRRSFMSRGALLCAGGLTLPSWARWLHEQMGKLQPRQHVVLVSIPPLVPLMEYYIDASNGDDRFAGTADAPLATFAEFARRAPPVIEEGQTYVGRFRHSLMAPYLLAPFGMRMFLTRVGLRSKVVITGDPRPLGELAQFLPAYILGDLTALGPKL